jgi:hypothetical protein
MSWQKVKDASQTGQNVMPQGSNALQQGRGIPAGGNPGQLQGMGIDRGNQTDSQFQLGPGQTGYALFSVA